MVASSSGQIFKLWWSNGQTWNSKLTNKSDKSYNFDLFVGKAEVAKLFHPQCVEYVESRILTHWILFHTNILCFLVVRRDYNGQVFDSLVHDMWLKAEPIYSNASPARMTAGAFGNRIQIDQIKPSAQITARLLAHTDSFEWINPINFDFERWAN